MKNNPSTPILTSVQALQHWQGHRNLSRKVIEAFPENKLFTYSIGGMRPFFELAMEMIHIAAPGAEGMATRNWKPFGELDTEGLNSSPETKEELLELWDWTTNQINHWWEQIPEGRFEESETIFGQYEGQIWDHLLYFIDNEVHHRGQGYVYLRSLGIEPPYFWER